MEERKSLLKHIGGGLHVGQKVIILGQQPPELQPNGVGYESPQRLKPPRCAQLGKGTRGHAAVTVTASPWPGASLLAPVVQIDTSGTAPKSRAL